MWRDSFGARHAAWRVAAAALAPCASAGVHSPCDRVYVARGGCAPQEMTFSQARTYCQAKVSCAPWSAHCSTRPYALWPQQAPTATLTRQTPSRLCRARTLPLSTRRWRRTSLSPWCAQACSGPRGDDSGCGPGLPPWNCCGAGCGGQQGVPHARGWPHGPRAQRQAVAGGCRRRKIRRALTLPCPFPQVREVVRNSRVSGVVNVWLGVNKPAVSARGRFIAAWPGWFDGTPYVPIRVSKEGHARGAARAPGYAKPGRSPETLPLTLTAPACHAWPQAGPAPYMRRARPSPSRQCLKW
jgi:hypothetical protein